MRRRRRREEERQAVITSSTRKREDVAVRGKPRHSAASTHPLPHPSPPRTYLMLAPRLLGPRGVLHLCCRHCHGALDAVLLVLVVLIGVCSWRVPVGCVRGGGKEGRGESSPKE